MAEPNDPVPDEPTVHRYPGGHQEEPTVVHRHPGSPYDEDPTVRHDPGPHADQPPPGGMRPGYAPPPPGHGPRPDHGAPPPGYGARPDHGAPLPGYGPRPGDGAPQFGYGPRPGDTAPPPGYGPPPGDGAPPTGYGPRPGDGAPQFGYGARPDHGAPLPGYGPPPGDAPPPRQRGRLRPRTIAIVVGVAVAVIVLGALGVRALLAEAGNALGLPAGVADAGLGCDAVSAADVDAALGGSYELVQLGAAGGAAGFVLDSRVLADAPTCWGVEETGGRLVRIAVHTGPDAAERFAAEKQTAQGSSQDAGGGITVSSDGYFAGDTGAGDEAFCTSGDALGAAGALVRIGERLVYVSTTAAGGGASAVPEIGLTDGKITFGTDAENCAKAVAVAERVR